MAIKTTGAALACAVFLLAVTPPILANGYDDRVQVERAAQQMVDIDNYQMEQARKRDRDLDKWARDLNDPTKCIKHEEVGNDGIPIVSCIPVPPKESTMGVGGYLLLFVLLVFGVVSFAKKKD